MNIHEQSVTQLLQGLASGAYSATDAVRTSLDRIRRSDPAVQAFITVDDRGALEQAKESDRRYRAGEARALEGVPVAIKDVLCTRGLASTAASRMLEGYVPPYDATAVARLRDAGAVIVGKTNCDAFAHGASTEHSDFFTTNNPWDLARVPGGSSGGSAASVAARQVPASLGSDTGGSIRQPASFCGVTGLKPTYGRVSRYGLMAMTSSTDCVGPMARTAQDCAALLAAMAGRDRYDGTSSDEPVTDYAAAIARTESLDGVRIGMPVEYFESGERGMQPAVREVIDAAVRQLADLGADIQEVSLPHTKHAVPAYYVITPAEVSSNLARLDGIRYGYSLEQDKETKDTAADLLESYMKNRRYGFGAEAKRRIMLGTYALSSGYFDQYYGKAAAVRTLIAQDFEQALAGVDALVAPVSPHVAFKLGEQVDDPLAMYLEDVFSTAASLAGVPSVSVPCGMVKPADGKTAMPVGMQLIGPKFDEASILAMAAAYQRATGWHDMVPELVAGA